MRFDENEFRASLYDVFERNGLASLLDDGKADKLMLLTEILITENEKYNLTAITEPKKIILHHYADCAVLAMQLPEGATLADIGCGAGFPTLPVAVLRPDVSITGIDSTAKRIAYVSNTAEALGLKNVTAIAARAEELGGGRLRESFQFVTARAVATMRVLSELALPFVKVGGSFIAMKGKNAATELAESAHAISALGGKQEKTEEISLASEDETLTHPLIYVKKVRPTPTAYPRPFAQISKKPL